MCSGISLLFPFFLSQVQKPVEACNYWLFLPLLYINAYSDQCTHLIQEWFHGHVFLAFRGKHDLRGRIRCTGPFIHVCKRIRDMELAPSVLFGNQGWNGMLGVIPQFPPVSQPWNQAADYIS